MSDNPLIEEFLNYLKYERHFSPHTAKCYAADLGQFCGFVSVEESKEHPPLLAPFDSSPAYGAGPAANRTTPDGSSNVTTEQACKLRDSLLAVDPEEVRRYLMYLNGQEYSKSTVARKLATLRSFYKFCLRRGYVKNNPLSSIRTPKQEKKLPKYLELDQIIKLLHTPDDTTLLGSRDRAMLEVMFSTGVRVSEVVAIRIEDVDFTGESIRIRGKGKKERISPLSQSAVGALKKYLSIRQADSRSSSFDPHMLFVNKHGKSLSTRSVRRKLDKYLLEAGLDPTVSPHTLRHSFATHMLNNGADLRSVQELLGHQSISTTQTYTQLANRKIRDSYNDAHPRS